MTITLGWWIVPLLVTVAAALSVAWTWRHDDGGYLPDMTRMFTVPAALIVTLIAWLVWALLR